MQVSKALPTALEAKPPAPVPGEEQPATANEDVELLDGWGVLDPWAASEPKEEPTLPSVAPEAEPVGPFTTAPASEGSATVRRKRATTFLAGLTAPTQQQVEQRISGAPAAELAASGAFELQASAQPASHQVLGVPEAEETPPVLPQPPMSQPPADEHQTAAAALAALLRARVEERMFQWTAAQPSPAPEEEPPPIMADVGGLGSSMTSRPPAPESPSSEPASEQVLAASVSWNPHAEPVAGAAPAAGIPEPPKPAPAAVTPESGDGGGSSAAYIAAGVAGGVACAVLGERGRAGM
jgi:hypothetical protein